MLRVNGIELSKFPLLLFICFYSLLLFVSTLITVSFSAYVINRIRWQVSDENIVGKKIHSSEFYKPHCVRRWHTHGSHSSLHTLGRTSLDRTTNSNFTGAYGESTVPYKQHHSYLQILNISHYDSAPPGLIISWLHGVGSSKPAISQPQIH